MDVAAWLDALGLGEYAQAFVANHVDAATLPQLTADDLRDLGVVSVGHRRRLLAAIAALGAGAAGAAPPAPPPAPARAERRPVTVLFADLCGFTALTRGLPDEQLHALLERYLGTADEIVRRHGGTVDKHIGDAVMALFGAPVAHGDDMLRAARAALELRDAMPGLSQAIGRTLSMHAGLAAGEVIVGASGGAYTAVGESVNMAARLTALAPAGEVFVSDQLQRALTGQVAVEPRGTHAVKGFDAPVTVWRLAGLAAADAAPPLSPFVGRGAELAQAAALLDGCASGRAGGVIYIRGEPGIGKSRLVGEALRLAGQRAIACHVGHVLDFGAGQARDPRYRLANSLLGLGPDAAPAARADAVETALAAGPLDRRLRPFLTELVDAAITPELRTLLDASGEASRRAGRRDALAALAAWALARAPQMLVVEDVHWADAALIEALLPLARLARDRPLALVCSTRPQNEVLHEALRGQADGAPLVTIDLGPLAPQDAGAMVAQLARLPDGLLQQCLARAGGNPLFLEQLMRSAAEGAGELPPSLRGLVLARVDRLAPADRDALQAAAVLGARLDPAALRATLGDPGYDPAGLLRAGLLRGDGGELVFAHALIREAVQRSLLAEAQRTLHGRAAGWFAGRDAMLCAVHLDHAGSPEAAVAYRRAAEERLQRYRPGEALPLVERGLALVAQDEARAALLVLKGDVLLDGGKAREALAAYQAAIALSGAPRDRCLALLGSAAARRVIDELPAALDDVAAAEAIARDGGWLDLEARCRYTRGNLYFPLGRVQDCLAEHGAALDLAERSGNAEAKVRALGGLGDAEYALGHMIGCGRWFERCVAESRRIGLGRVEVSNLAMLGFSLDHALALGRALAVGEEAIALSAAVGQIRAEMIARHLCVLALLDLGRAAEARPHVERASAIARELEAWRFEAENQALLAEIELECGRRDAARAAAEAAVGHARATSMGFWGPAALAVAARLADDRAARGALAAEAHALLAGQVLAHNQHIARRHLIEMALADGDPDTAEDHAARLDAFYRAEPTPLASFIARRARVLAAALRGTPSPALAAEAQALLDEAAAAGAALLARGLPEARDRLLASGTARLP